MPVEEPKVEQLRIATEKGKIKARELLMEKLGKAQVELAEIRVNGLMFEEASNTPEVFEHKIFLKDFGLDLNGDTHRENLAKAENIVQLLTRSLASLR